MGHQIRSQGQLSRLRSTLTLYAVLKSYSTCRFQPTWHRVLLAYSLVRTNIAALIGLLSRRTMIKVSDRPYTVIQPPRPLCFKSCCTLTPTSSQVRSPNDRSLKAPSSNIMPNGESLTSKRLPPLPLPPTTRPQQTLHRTIKSCITTATASSTR